MFGVDEFLPDVEDLSGGMICGQSEAQVRRYRLLVGKSGRRWLVADQPNEADNVYVEADPRENVPGYRGFRGFAGATLKFPLVNGETVELTGPWHSNSDSLFSDTGYDCRNTALTQVTVALERDSQWPRTFYRKVVYHELEPQLGQFDRSRSIGKEWANKLNRRVFVLSKSYGGSSSTPVEPDRLEEK